MEELDSRVGQCFYGWLNYKGCIAEAHKATSVLQNYSDALILLRERCMDAAILMSIFSCSGIILIMLSVVLALGARLLLYP